MPDPEQVDRYFEALARAVTEGRIPSTRDPLPLRSLAEVLAEVAQDEAGEAIGAGLILAILVHRLGGDVTITHADLADTSYDLNTEVTDETVRLTTS